MLGPETKGNIQYTAFKPHGDNVNFFIYIKSKLMSYDSKLALLRKKGGEKISSFKVSIDHNNFTNSFWLFLP